MKMQVTHIVTVDVDVPVGIGRADNDVPSTRMHEEVGVVRDGARHAH